MKLINQIIQIVLILFIIRSNYIFVRGSLDPFFCIGNLKIFTYITRKLTSKRLANVALTLFLYA